MKYFLWLYTMGRVEVYSILTNTAEKWPDQCAVIEDMGETSYQELYEKAERVKNFLISRGVGEGEGLGIRIKDGADFIAALFGGVGAGLTVMPLSDKIEDSELDDLLEQAPLSYLLDGELDNLKVLKDDPSVLAPHVEEATFIRFTSGTTGDSKGVILSSRAVLERTEILEDFLELSEKDQILFMLPMAYHFIASVVLYVRAGATICISKERAQIEKSTILYGAPSQYSELTALEQRLPLSRVRLAVSTSVGLTKENWNRFYERFSIPITQAYGVIEIGLPLFNLNSDKGKAIAIGSPIPGCEVAIVDDHGELVPSDTIGNLALRGKGAFDAYLSPDRSFDDVALNGWFVTGDLGKIGPDGVVTVKGRKISSFEINNQRIFPEEIEGIINEHDAIQSSRAFISDNGISNRVEIEIVKEPSAQLNQDDYHSICSQRLEDKLGLTIKDKDIFYSITLVDTIEKTGSGKVVRH